MHHIIWMKTPIMCFHKGPLVYTWVVWTLYSSLFSPSFFIGLRRICLRAKVSNLDFIICSVADRSKVEWISYSFLNEKKDHSLLSSIYSPECWKSHFRALEISKFSEGAYPQIPLEKGDLFIQSVTLFKPPGYLYFYWNPWTNKKAFIQGANVRTWCISFSLSQNSLSDKQTQSEKPALSLR